MSPGEQESQGQGVLPPAELLEFIHKGNKFLVAGHIEPDGDCIGSQLVLVSALRRLGKEAFPCSSGPFKKPEVKQFEKYFHSSIISEEKKSGARLIITDCGYIDRIGTDLAARLKGLPLAIIDHHEVVFTGGNETIPVYHAPTAASTTTLILRLLDALGLEPAKEEAELLLLGLCTDTGFFRHVDTDGSECFDTASRLVKLGANPQKAFRDINGGKNFESRLFMGHVLARAESYFGGKLIFSAEEYEDIQRYGIESRDSDAVYLEFQSIAGVEAIVLVRQEDPDSCSIGFRSRGDLDVGEIAKSFGGGGHKNASGANSVNGTIEEIKPLIIDAFRHKLPD